MVMTEFTHKTEPVSRSHIAHAFILMLSLIMIATITRGEDGDSLDRERVRDIMNQIYDGGYNPFQHLAEEVVA